jgi:hypothetical protein
MQGRRLAGDLRLRKLQNAFHESILIPAGMLHFSQRFPSR